jgi:hypothetical protein
VWAIAGHREILVVNPNEALPRPECGVRFVLPLRLFHRSAVQASVIAVWGDPQQPFDEVVNDAKRLWKIIIPKEARRHIR